MYSVPTSVWRAPIPHFSPWDPNWPFGPPAGATPPPGPPPGTPPTPPDPCKSTNNTSPNASTIECQNGILHESIPIAGTPYELVYSSDRVAGFTAANRLLVPLSGATLPPDVTEIELEIDLAGRSFTSSFPASANLTTTFDWDGQDAFGRQLQGVQQANVSIGYTYNGVYFKPGESPNGATYDALFGHFSFFGVPATGDRTRQDVTLWSRYTVPIGHWSAEPLGFGGWTVDVQHVYEAYTGTLRLGTGEVQPADTFGKVITTVAGTGATGSGGDNGPATSAQLNQPWNVALAPDGSLYIDDRNNFRIRRVDANGIITTVAGTGSAGFNGDGHPATQSQLNNPESVIVAPDGSFYIADVANQRVRKVDVNGIMTTVAGTGVSGYSGDGGPATSAELANPNGLFLAPDGSLYIADSVNSVIRKVDPSGTISTVAGTGVSGFNGDGQTATKAQLFNAHSTVVDRDGTMYIADRVNHRIRRVGVDGVITTIAGTGTLGFSGDGGPAVSAQISEPHNLLLGSDGTLYFSDHFNARIRAIRPDGIITTIAGNGTVGFSGDHGPALDAEFNPGQFVCGLALTADGQFMYIGDGNNNRVRRLSLAQPMFSNTAFGIAARDGSEVYGFDSAGHHLRTTALPSNAIKVSLGYDASGLLATLTDGSGNVTTVQRDSSGNPTGVVSPFGVMTTLALGGDGYLGTVTGPVGATYQMTYQSGLLSVIQFPTGSPTKQSTKTYDSLGRVLTSTDAAGHALTFSRAPDTASSVNVSKTTSLGVQSQYAISLAPTGASTWTNTLPDGITSTQQLGADGSQTVTAADGTKTTHQPGPDPRFGMQAPVIATQTVTLPSGLTQNRSTSRAVTLSNPLDPLSIVTETDTATVNGKTWTTSFNAAQGAFTMTTPVGRTTTTMIDAAGHPTQLSMPGIAATVMFYDSRGRLSTTTQGTFLKGGAQVPRTWTKAYDSLGYANSTTDPLGVVTTTTNDAVGRATTTLLPDGQGGTRTLLASYDGDDDLTSLTLPGGAQHALSYTPVDGLASYVPPSLGTGNVTTQYQYDEDGRIALETRPDGATIGYDYDSAGRLQTTTYPQGAITRGYDPTTGKLTSIAAPSGITLAFGYDGVLHKSTTWSGPVPGSVLFGYNPSFEMTSQSVNGGTALTFGYDDDSLMTQAGALAMTRDPQNGRVTGSTLGSITDGYAYDANGMLASYSASFNSTVLYSETIGARDGDGRITQRTEIAGGTTHVWGYTYDTAGRLTDVVEDGSAVSHYGYDADDNRTTFTNAGGTIHPAYDAQDRLQTYGGTTYAYGANGELQSKTVGSQTTMYQYDVFGNLLHVAPAGGSPIDYIVDGQNRRVGKKVGGALTTGFLYQNALNVVAQLDASGNVVARYVYGSKRTVPDYFTTAAGTFRILSDHLGSPRVIVNASSGSIVERIDYDEFGNVTNDTAPAGLPFGFAGGLYDSGSGFVRFGARDYDPTIGRWVSKDPIRFAGGMNLYGYGLNDPIDHVDPKGRNFSDCLAALEEQAEVCLAAIEDPALWPECVEVYLLANQACGPGSDPPQPAPSPAPPNNCPNDEICPLVGAEGGSPSDCIYVCESDGFRFTREGMIPSENTCNAPKGSPRSKAGRPLSEGPL
jgi:RHS repeat-associated protein